MRERSKPANRAAGHILRCYGAPRGRGVSSAETSSCETGHGVQEVDLGERLILHLPVDEDPAIRHQLI